MKTPILVATAALISVVCFSPCRISGAGGGSPSPPPAQGKVDPNQILTGLERDIKELIADNDKNAFDIKPADSKKVKDTLSSMRADVSKLLAKYRGTKDQVDAPALYKDINATLNEKEGGNKSLILSLKKKGISTKSHECENFCWESCGHNSVGEWVCFLTCRRHCT